MASGRGALLKKLLEEQAAPGAHSTPGTEEKCVPVPRGRAAALLRMQAAAEAQPGSSGRGRALAMTLAALSNEPDIQQLSIAAKPYQEKEMPQEPVIKHGEMGHRVTATANYIRLKMAPGMGIFEYEVRFEPGIDSMNIRFRYINAHFGREKTFDGVTLYLPSMLPDDVTRVPVENKEGEKYMMTIIFKKKKDLKDCLHTYNVCFKRIFGILGFKQLNRSHYNPKSAKAIPKHKLELWPGYVTAVDEYEDGLMLCCDSSHRVLRCQTVLNLLSELSYQDPQNYRENLAREVVGMSVLTRYNNRLYKVEDIDWKQTPLSTFNVRRDGKEEPITYKEYYRKQYEVEIRDDNQPLLIHIAKKDVPGSTKKAEQFLCLVPELCYLTGMSDAMKSDFHIMRDIATYTRITPNQRQDALNKFIDNVNNSEEARAVLATWGLSLDTTTVPLDSRICQAERILFGQGGKHEGTEKADWNNSLARNQVLKAMALTNWCVIHTIRNKTEVTELVSHMTKCCPQLGMEYAAPRTQLLSSDSTDSFLRAIKEQHNKGTQIVVIMCPTARDDRYAAIKKLCCADQPIPSQVINGRTLSRPDKNRAIVMKIALQMNCKLGGSLWTVDLPIKNVMVIGFDTYHDPTKRSASVGGFVASLSNDMTRWYSRVCIQEPQQELIDNLKINFTAAVQRYYQINRVYPARIIIFRDGLGDGQLNMSLKFEVPQLQSCFPAISEMFNPKMTFIVCQKRINTRIFSRAGNGLDNPPPGTVVDNTITRRYLYDFFLVSQHVRQGTVTPTHYVVVYDNCDMKVDHVQKLTFKLCHLYYNWPGTIRVPAPVQYAHKLAQLVGQCVKRVPSHTLDEQLYYL